MLGNGRKLVGAVLACACTGAVAGPGYWSGNGPWGGVARSVHVPGGAAGATTAYVITRGGLFRTVDGGLSWTRADVGIPGGLVEATAFAVDDLAPATLTAVDLRGRVHRSVDGGDNWIATGHEVPASRRAAAFADVPGDSTGLLMAMIGDPALEVQLARSLDGGATFTPVPPGQGLPVDLGWNTIAIDPANANLVLVGATASTMDTTGVPSDPSVYRSTDGGVTWSASLTLVGYEDYIPHVFDIAFGAGSTIYASTELGVYRSDNDGVSWNGPYQDLTFVQALLPHPADALTVLLGSTEGLQQSTDGGVTASPMNSGLGSNSTYVSELDGTTVLTSDVTGLAAEPAWPAPGSVLWASTSGGGVFRSSDGGASWTARNEGIGATNVRALAVHPNPSTIGPVGGQYIYAGFGDAFRGSPALFRTINFGTTWNVFNSQLEASQIRAIAIDPTTAGTTSADLSTSHMYAAGGPAVVEGYVNGGLYKSTNGGITWSTIDATLPVRNFGAQTAPMLGTVRSLVLDPRSCAFPPSPPMPCTSGPLQRVYATSTGHTPPSSGPGVVRTSTHRIIRSDDAGATWTALDADLPPTTALFTTGAGSVNQSVTPLSLVLSGSDPNVLYVGTFTAYNGHPGAVFEDRESGVFRSSDGGLNWEQRSGGLPRVPGYANTVVDVLALAIHPLDHDTLWATAYDLQGGSAVHPVYKTVDGGLNWLPSATGLPAGIDLRALIVDPGDPDILYASGYYPGGDDGSGGFANPPGVFRSDDGGATWLSISGGLQARSVLAMTLDPFQPQVLHLGTNTGVWTMEQVPDEDGDGAPDAVENNAPNFGDGDGDGEPDSTQGSVGSTIVIFGGVAAAKGAQAGVTAKVSPMEGTCTQNVDVQALLAARFGRDYLPGARHYHSYPRDLVRFEVMECAKAQVDLIFHGADFLGEEGWSFRMFGPSTPGEDDTVGWFDLSERASAVAPDRWRLELERDAMGSYRSGGTSILFMGGPACNDPRIFTDRLGDPVTPGCDD